MKTQIQRSSARRFQPHSDPKEGWCLTPTLRRLLHLSVQFSSVAQLCPTLCDPMDCSTPGFPVHHQLPELAQIHVHRIGDAIQPSHPLSFPLLPSIFPNIRIFSNESVLHIRWPKYWSFSFSISPSNESPALPTPSTHNTPLRNILHTLSNPFHQKLSTWAAKSSLGQEGSEPNTLPLDGLI